MEGVGGFKVADGKGATAQWRKMQEPRPARWTQPAVAAAAAGQEILEAPAAQALASQERKMP